jgi:integrase
MASKYLRRSLWWIQFYHPVTRALIRESLDTTDEARAELLRERLDHEVALLDPRFQATELPPRVREILSGGRQDPVAGSAISAPSPAPLAVPAVPQRSLDEALTAYLEFIRIENAPHHVANKLSILRRFFGSARIGRLGGQCKVSPGKRGAGSADEPFFTGETVHEIGPALVQKFIEELPVATKTKRHYREVFHHFFEFCLKFAFYQSANAHCPNPVGALPGYVCRNRRIVFLTAEQVEEQLRTLEPHPTLRIAAAIMIHAGLRRAETLWLSRESVSPDLSYLSVVNQVDHDADLESSLKTGERTVTISPPLKALLAAHLSALKGKWIVPSPSGRQWHGDAFGKMLRKVNAASGLKWSSLHYRHTFATHRAAEGWTLFRLSKEMGNSVSVIEEYYAGYLRPPAQAA